MTEPTLYNLQLRAISGHDLPAPKRLAKLLKFALRSCGLRCVECREIEPLQDDPEAIQTNQLVTEEI